MAGKRERGLLNRLRATRDEPGYPAHWEADIALRDGSAAHLRPITPQDADALQEFHTRQSERSRYLRFFAAMPRLSARDLERFTVVDHRDRVAFIVLVGEDIVAVGRYDRTSEDEAEVAFNVADARQGTGLASALLEHLVAAARENGIRTFTAEVLPQNTKMISVFTDAGFEVERVLDDGVVMVSFRIDPTDRYRAVMDEREHAAEARAMEQLLHPESVMIVGVSTRGDSPGGRVLTALESSGFDGAVHIVARDVFEIRGHRTHSSIREVPGPVDLAVIALRPEACLDAIEDCAAIGVRSILIPTEGFADNERAADLQRRLVARARLHGMRLLGPGSFGFLRTGDDALSISLSPAMPRAGAVALAGQSSALAAMLLAGSDERGTGLREFVAVGNRADVSINDCLQHWEDDPTISVVAVALESMGNPRKFTRIARRLSRTRPVVVLRPPGVGSGAPPGHDVRASTLPRRALDQVLASAGVVRADGGVDHLMDVTDAIARQGLPQGPRVGLLSNTPALGEALRGAADLSAFDVVVDNRSVPLAASHRLVQRAFTSMAALGDVDLVVAGVLDPLVGDPVAMVRQMSDVARGAGVALLVCLISTQERAAAVQSAVRADPHLPPVHATPRTAVRAAAGMLAAAIRPGAQDEPVPVFDDIDRDRARRIVEHALASSASSTAPVELPPEQVEEILAAYGLDVLPARRAASAQEAVVLADELGYPAVLKSADPVLRHRADLGGVRLGIADPEQLRRDFAQMQRDLAYSHAPLEVQRMAPPGVPVVVRTTEDPALGPVISFSLAGDATDLLDDIAYAIPPLGPREARELIDRPASAVRLRGRHGLPPADLDALADLLMRIALLAEDLPELANLELYPVLVGRRGCSIVGASAHVHRAPNRTDSGRRALSGPPEL